MENSDWKQKSKQNKMNESSRSLAQVSFHTRTTHADHFKGEKEKTVYFDIILLLTLKHPHHIEKQENGRKQK